jgi:hypothetical protein
MLKIIIIFFTLFLVSCATPLTSGARNLHVVGSVSSELVVNCKKIGAVAGYAQPGWGNNVGLQQAMNDALNKAAKIPNGDTFAVSNQNRSFNGGQVNGMVFDCSKERVQSIKIVGSESPQEHSANVFSKAKKCQFKGGVWINDQCVIQLD